MNPQSIKLKVLIFRQPKNSVLCGPTCLQMIYAYYGIKKPARQIAKEIPMYEFGSYVADLGLHLLKNGFSVTIFSKSSWCFLPSDSGFSEEELVKVLKKRLKNKKQKYRRNIKKIISFIRAGGGFKVEVVNENLIKKELETGRPDVLFSLYNQGGYALFIRK